MDRLETWNHHSLIDSDIIPIQNTKLGENLDCNEKCLFRFINEKGKLTLEKPLWHQK